MKDPLHAMTEQGADATAFNVNFRPLAFFTFLLHEIELFEYPIFALFQRQLNLRQAHPSGRADFQPVFGHQHANGFSLGSLEEILDFNTPDLQSMRCVRVLKQARSWVSAVVQ